MPVEALLPQAARDRLRVAARATAVNLVAFFMVISSFFRLSFSSMYFFPQKGIYVVGAGIARPLPDCLH